MQSLRRFYEKYGHLLIVLVLLLGLFIRIHHIANEHFEPVNYDQKNYTNMAIRIIEEGVYGYRAGAPDTLVTPGFPLLLAGFFSVVGYSDTMETHMLFRYFQAFMALGYIWFIYLIGKRLFNRATGLIAALMASIYSTFVMMTSLILTETIFLTSFMALIYFQVRIMQNNRLRDHLWAGALLALTVLIRPNSIVVAATPYLFIMIQHRKLYLKQILWGIGAFAAVMLPWWIRNLVTFHELILVSKGGAGNPLLGGTDPYFRGTIPWNDIKGKDEQAIAIERIKEGLATDPGLWIRWFTVGKLKYMFIQTFYFGSYPAFTGELYGKFLKYLHFALVYVGMVGGLIAAYWNRNVLFLFVNFLLFLGIHLMFIPEARYTIGMMPFLMLICSYLGIVILQYMGKLLENIRK